MSETVDQRAVYQQQQEQQQSSLPFDVHAAISPKATLSLSAAAAHDAVMSAVSPRDPAMKVVSHANHQLGKQATGNAKPSLLASVAREDFPASPPMTCVTPSNQVVSGLTQVHPTIQPSAYHDGNASSPTSAAVSSCSSVTSSSETGTAHALPSKRGASASASPKATSPKQVKGNTGRWTEAEHKLFLKGLETFPYRAWKKIATLIKTRTVVQIRTHAQKYYQKLEKEEARMREREQQLAQQQKLRNGAANAESSQSALGSDIKPTISVTETSASLARKKAVSRKRKMSNDEAPVSMNPPKRMHRDKRCVRAERTMSPKEKHGLPSAKFSFPMPEASPSHASDLAHHRVGPLPRPTGLEFDDVTHSSSISTILDFPEDKSMNDFPLAIDGCLEQCVSFDSDEFLQLTDEESLDWFTGDKDEKSDDKKNSSNSSSKDPVDDECARQPFSPLPSSDASLELGPSGVPSAVSSDPTADLIFGGGEEDDDFVLDPEKFLSSYLSPSSSLC